MTAAAGALCARAPAALAGDAASWRPDGSGATRIGLLVPDFDFNPEAEIWAMAPKGVAIFASRMERGSLPFQTYLADPAHADVAVASLMKLRLKFNVILYAYTTTSYVMGLAGEAAFRSRLESHAQGVPVVLPATALAEALKALVARRIALVHPPWFPEQQVELGRTYFAARGFDVAFCAGIKPARQYTEVAAEEVHSWIVAHAPRDIDAVVVAGNGLRVVGAIEALEASFGKPVITANQAMLWRGMRIAGAQAGVPGYGKLFGIAWGAASAAA
ncbi:MAG: maleate cis-trans isomerase family protein [Gammaproteobacteria bacterium]